MTKIVILGAGGKMGYRCSSNLVGSPWQVSHVEVSAAGQERLKPLGIVCQPADEVLPEADAVTLIESSASRDCSTRP